MADGGEWRANNGTYTLHALSGSAKVVLVVDVDVVLSSVKFS